MFAFFLSLTLILTVLDVGFETEARQGAAGFQESRGDPVLALKKQEPMATVGFEPSRPWNQQNAKRSVKHDCVMGGAKTLARTYRGIDRAKEGGVEKAELFVINPDFCLPLRQDLRKIRRVFG